MVINNYLIISMISRLKYFNEESSKTNKNIQEQLFNTSYIQQQSTTNSLKALDSNTDSQGLNNKSRSVANSQNDIIPSPDITTSKTEDFPVSSNNDHDNQIAIGSLILRQPNN